MNNQKAKDAGALRLEAVRYKTEAEVLRRVQLAQGPQAAMPPGAGDFRFLEGMGEEKADLPMSTRDGVEESATKGGTSEDPESFGFLARAAEELEAALAGTLAGESHFVFGEDIPFSSKGAGNISPEGKGPVRIGVPGPHKEEDSGVAAASDSGGSFLFDRKFELQGHLLSANKPETALELDWAEVPPSPALESNSRLVKI